MEITIMEIFTIKFSFSDIFHSQSLERSWKLRKEKLKNYLDFQLFLSFDYQTFHHSLDRSMHTIHIQHTYSNKTKRDRKSLFQIIFWGNACPNCLFHAEFRQNFIILLSWKESLHETFRDRHGTLNIYSHAND